MKRCTAALAELTGFEHAVFVHSGTAALELALLTLTERTARVAMPALACWTVPFAIQKVGRTPVFVEVDEAWAIQKPPVASDAVVVIDPWGSAADWSVAADVPARILDATQSPGARCHGKLGADVFDAAIISFGTGKPIDLHGGGVALFRDAAAAREAKRLMGFGIQRGRWTETVDRYTFCSHLFAPLAELLERELAALPAHREQAHALRAQLGPIVRSNPLPAYATPGIRGALPILVDKTGLTADEVERVAVASQQPPRRHPVAVAYREPAWSGPVASCPRAEHIGDHVLFVERGASLAGVEAFARELAERRDEFRVPYRLPLAAARFLADQLAHYREHAAVCRALDGAFWVLDYSTLHLRQVSPAVAAVIQHATLEAHHDRAARTA